jgi:GT2 family glycosyltransferase
VHVRISIVTPWLDHPELIPDYENAVRAPGVEVIVVDNASGPENAGQLVALTERLGGRYLRNSANHWFSAASNQGLAAANGDVIVFLNNDVCGGPGWLEAVENDVTPGTLCGPALMSITIGTRELLYLEGWCLAGRRELWQALGGWDARSFDLDPRDADFNATAWTVPLLARS